MSKKIDPEHCTADEVGIALGMPVGTWDGDVVADAGVAEMGPDDVELIPLLHLRHSPHTAQHPKVGAHQGDRERSSG